jgi:hypothetical protein
MKKISFTIYYNKSSEVNYNCCLFELRGILYKNVIFLLIRLDVTSLPKKYFLNRWRKDLKRKYKFIKNSYNPLKSNPSAKRYFDLCKDMHVLAEFASTTMKNYMKMKNHIRILTKQLSGLSYEHYLPSQALQVGSTSNLSADGTMAESNKMHSLLVKRIKEKPSSIRLMSTMVKKS